jgi:hypothetical protein
LLEDLYDQAELWIRAADEIKRLAEELQYQHACDKAQQQEIERLSFENDWLRTALRAAQIGLAQSGAEPDDDKPLGFRTRRCAGPIRGRAAIRRGAAGNADRQLPGPDGILHNTLAAKINNWKSQLQEALDYIEHRGCEWTDPRRAVPPERPDLPYRNPALDTGNCSEPRGFEGQR